MRALSSVWIWLRFALFLLREFRWPLGVFAGLVLLGGLVLQRGYDGDPLGYPEACYSVFMLIFLENYLNHFPQAWYLELAFFMVPIVGLGAIADSVVRLAHLTFSRKGKLPEWQRIMASMYRDHVVVLGVGKVGLHIVKGLVALKEPVVAIEQVSQSAFVDELHDLRVPVIAGDGRQRKILEQAGVARARAAILATNDDLANLDAALTAREINPHVRVVLRLFDDTLAVKVAGAFAMPTFSTSQVSAPAFIAAATGRKVYHEFQLAGRRLHLIDITVSDEGRLAGQTVGEIQATKEVNVVMHQSQSDVSVNPEHDRVLKPGDTALVIAPIDRLVELEGSNRPRGLTGDDLLRGSPPTQATVDEAE